MNMDKIFNDYEKIRTELNEEELKNWVRPNLAELNKFIKDNLHQEFTIYKKGAIYDASFKQIESTVKKSKEEFLSEYDNLKKLAEKGIDNPEKIVKAIEIIKDYNINDLQEISNIQQIPEIIKPVPKGTEAMKQTDDKARFWANLAIIFGLVPDAISIIIGSFLIPTGETFNSTIPLLIILTIILVLVAMVAPIIALISGIIGVKGQYKRGYFGIIVGIYGTFYMIPKLVVLLPELFKLLG